MIRNGNDDERGAAPLDDEHRSLVEWPVPTDEAFGCTKGDSRHSAEASSIKDSDIPRRHFLGGIGAITIGFATIGVFGGQASSVQGVRGQVGSPCLNEDQVSCGGPDGDCDAASGVTSGRDQSCNDSPIWCLTDAPETDEACAAGSGNPEEGPNHDTDEACSSSDTDEACKLQPASNPGNSGKDTDESCGGSNNNADEACGDCNDSHDPDQNCGNEIGGAGGPEDSDQMCGHSSYYTTASDQACQGPDDVDEGCGIQDPTYADADTDTDQACGLVPSGGTVANIDRNCSQSQDPDATCNQSQPPFASSPDEGCGNPGDIDEGCGQTADPSYDMDNACSQTDPDESCGAGIGPDNPEDNNDESCSLTSTDEACGTYNLPWSPFTHEDVDENNP